MASAVAQGGSVSSVGSVDAYTPHLKRVLKSYRAAATTSLHGPNNVRWSAAPSEEKEEEDDSLSPLLSNSSANPTSESTKSTTTALGEEGAEGIDPGTGAGPSAAATSAASGSGTTTSVTRPAIPQQPPPLLLPLPTDRKSSGQRTSTLLEGELIASFNVGGEERLCLPQIFNTVLRNFSLQQIYAVCDDFQIYCSRCTDDQLAQLKEASILPFSVTSCGLIRRSDAERVCSELLHVPVTDERPKLLEQLRAVHSQSPEGILAESEANGIPVYHECFGGCQGLVFVDLYITPVSPCVQCRECRGYLSPRNFISHVHRARAETRTCHWGFSSANWRQYLLRRDENDECAQQKLESLKTKFDKRKKRPSESCKSFTSGSTQGSLAPSPIGDDDENFTTNEDDKSDEICLAKKQRFVEEHEVPEMPFFPPSMEHAPNPLQPLQYPFVSLGVDPTMWYQWAASAARTSAFKPWQTDLCGLLVGGGKATVAPGTSSGASRAAPASPTHAIKSTHKLIGAGHSNSLDSAEDALSCTSSASERVVEAEDPQVAGAVPSYLGDVSGLQRVLEHHKLDCKVQKDVLNETMKIIYDYQQVVTSLVKQKHILEKELAHRLRADQKYPGLIQVKQEPIDEQADQTLGSGTVSKKQRSVSPDPKLKEAPDQSPTVLRESQSLIPG